ncbi:MAG TPA: methyltransferase domain-containing protein [Pseudonocardiaceae bacterium]|nr:methyltransferase domain-containing protein [Pseudonocardiaceae bacterium]
MRAVNDDRLNEFIGTVVIWLPALAGVTEKLAAGGRVADIGCGFGHSTMLMAQDFPNSTFIGYDYHDPSIEAARKPAFAREALAENGRVMMVEPFANDDVSDNLNPLGRLMYSASTLVCTPASLSQDVGTALGAQAGEARLGEIVRDAGFTRFRRATETPFNLVLEARP